MRPRHPAWPLLTLWAALALPLPVGAQSPSVPSAAPAAAPSAAPPAALPAAQSGAPTAAPAPAATEVAGTVAALDLQRHRLSVDAAGGRVEIGWDRNTLIYQPGGATTSAALQPGAAVKAGLDPSGTAYWIQVRQAPPAPPAAASPAAPAPAPARP